MKAIGSLLAVMVGALVIMVSIALSAIPVAVALVIAVWVLRSCGVL